MSTTMEANRAMNGKLVDVDPATVARWLADGDTVLVDVREDFEHAEERIDGAELMPLSKFDPKAVRERFGGKRVVFHCRSGKRSADAANRYGAIEPGEEPMFHLAGGIEAWKSDGRATVKPVGGKRLPIMRQVQMVAGSLVVVGVLLGVLVSPWFLIISGFVGAGLVFAGASGWCGMALLLGRMPWNRVKESGEGGGASCCAS